MDSFSASSTVVAPGEVTTLTVEAHDPDCPDTCTSGCGLYVRADLTQWTATGGTFPSEDNGTSGSPYTATADWQAPGVEDTYTVTVELSDSGSFICSGRKTTTASLDILVTTSTNQPPVVESLTAEPGQLFPDETSQLTCVASDPDGDALTYSWATDHGTVTPGAGGTATFTADTPGIATVECTATDPEGASGSDTIGISVTGAEPEKALTASLITPQRLAVDTRSDVYVVDRSAGGLVVIHLFSGELVYRLPLPGLSSVAVDWNDDLLLGGRGGADVRDRRGRLNLALNPGQALGRVADVAVDEVNRRYGVLYAGPGRVVIFNEAGAVVEEFGSIGDGPEQFKSPQGLGVTPAGEWVVADGGHGLIKVFDTGGTLVRSFGGLGGGAGEFVQLNDVAVDGDGLVYATDTFQSWVQVFNPDGSLREVLGTYGDEPGQFRTPAGVAPVAGFDRLLTASLNTSSVQVFVTSADPPATGPAPLGEISPTSLTFADQAVQTESAPQTVILTNTGDAPLGVRRVTLSGEFTQSNDCGGFVDPGESCSFSVRFGPVLAGPATGSMVVDTSDPGGPFTVSLSGSGFVPAGVLLDPDHLRFSDQEVGTVSDSKHSTLTNTGTVPLEILDITVTGEFFATNDCQPTLAGGSSCTISVQSAPLTVEDNLLGEVLVTSSAADSPHPVALRGRGVPGPIELSIADVTVDEDVPAGEAVFAVTLSFATDEVVLVDFATAADTAAESDDFQPVADTLAIPVGETSGTIFVPVVDDELLEPDEETFRVVLSNPVNAALADGEAVGTILDDELCLGPNLLVNPGAEQRTDAGAVAGWTDVVGGDWSRRFADPAPDEGRAYFFAGAADVAELVQDVDVSAYADAIDAGLQRFAFYGVVQTAGDDLARIVVEYRDALNSVVLDAFDSGELSSAAAWQRVSDQSAAPAGTGWIRVRLVATRLEEGADNDAYFDALSLRSVRSAAVSIDALWAYEGDHGVSASDFVVRLACPFYLEVGFDYSTADGSATADVDYLATAGSAVIPAGETDSPVPVSILGDEEDEGHETLLLTVDLTGPGDAVAVDTSALGVIVNDDFCPHGPGYWRRAMMRHGDTGWPVTWLLIGGVEYEEPELRAFLGYGGRDASLRLTRHLVATKLNLAEGSEPSILPTVDEADAFLAAHTPGSDPGGDARQEAERLKALLESYNEGSCP